MLATSIFIFYQINSIEMVFRLPKTEMIRMRFHFLIQEVAPQRDRSWDLCSSHLMVCHHCCLNYFGTGGPPRAPLSSPTPILAKIYPVYFTTKFPTQSFFSNKVWSSSCRYEFSVCRLSETNSSLIY